LRRKWEHNPGNRFRQLPVWLTPENSNLLRPSSAEYSVVQYKFSSLIALRNAMLPERILSELPVRDVKTAVETM
jgi:hypothetical protein